MKANRPPLSRARSLAAATLTAIALVTLSACSEQRIIPPSAPTPAPATARPRPAPPPSISGMDWRLAPLTPGDWRWTFESGQSVARFGDLLDLRCDRTARTVTLSRMGGAAGPAGSQTPVTISTSDATSTLSATLRTAPAPATIITLAANDPVLDAMAFSRGRFALDTPGQPRLIVPSRPEIGRVAEDCR